MKFGSVRVFFLFAGGGGKDFFFRFFASRQVKILFYFTKVINVFAAAYISLHDPQKGKKPYKSMFSIASFDLQLFSTQEEVLIHLVSVSHFL